LANETPALLASGDGALGGVVETGSFTSAAISGVAPVGLAKAAGKKRMRLAAPHKVQTAASPAASSSFGKGMSQRAQGTGIEQYQVRVLTTRVSQIMSCNPRLSESKATMMKPIQSMMALSIFAK